MLSRILGGAGKDRETERVLRHLTNVRRRGLGLKVHDWHLESAGAAELENLVETMIHWCKTTLGTCRRPYGIDFFDIVVAFRTDHDDDALSFRLDRLKPLELYQDPLAGKLIEQFSRALKRTPANIHVSLGFFSWGDAAHEALTQA